MKPFDHRDLKFCDAISVGQVRIANGDVQLLICISPGDPKAAPGPGSVGYVIPCVEDFGDFILYLCNAASECWGSEHVMLKNLTPKEEMN
jgi:hypothetical protein